MMLEFLTIPATVVKPMATASALMLSGAFFGVLFITYRHLRATSWGDKDALCLIFCGLVLADLSDLSRSAATSKDVTSAAVAGMAVVAMVVTIMRRVRDERGLPPATAP